MNSIKCKNCGLSNFPNEAVCRRCGGDLHARAIVARGSSASFGRYVPLLFIALVVGAVYYFYSGVAQDADQVNATRSKPPAVHTPQPSQGLSRTEYDRQRAANVGDAIRQNPGLEAQKKQQQETQRIMQQVSNSR